MNDRRTFLAGCAAGVVVLALPVGLQAAPGKSDEGYGISGDTFRGLIGQQFRCTSDEGFSVRVRLVDVWDGPAEPGVDQFALVFEEGGASGPSALTEGLYQVQNKKIGQMRCYLTPSDTRERHHVTYFGLLY